MIDSEVCEKCESISLHPNPFPEMKGVNLLSKTHTMTKAI